MLLGRLAIVSLFLVAGLAGPPAAAADPQPTAVTLAAPATYAGEATILRAQLQDEAGPVPAAPLVFERRVSGQWQVVGSSGTDADGVALLEAVLGRSAADNVFRARFEGSETHAAATSAPINVRLLRRNAVVALDGPTQVVDERTVTLRVRWFTGSGEPVAGPVRLDRRSQGGGWHVAVRLRTGADGSVTLRVRPRVDTRWRASAAGLDWVKSGHSAVLALDNRPPGRPVVLPARAPEPRIQLPPQRRAVGAGANPSITRIPSRVWRDMTGRSWHQGCPVGRAGLRLVRVNYWAYDGYRRRGELVVAAGAARQITGAVVAMYRRHFPIRAMYRVDRFGWSGRLKGANDYRSMAAGNTSAFNCRQVVNRPGVRSPHSWGRSLDLNTWENPYRSATGLVPNSWWQSRQDPRVAWRSHDHPVVRLLAAHGMRWTYGRNDSQHFDAAHRGGRVARHPGCEQVLCK